MAAFQGAVDLGYRYIETDVRLTVDGVVVVFHDATLDRTTNGSGRVAEWRWDELRHLDAGWSFGSSDGYPWRSTGTGVVRLEEAFDTFPDVHFNIDLKGAGMEWAVADVIRNRRRQDSTMIGSFVGSRVRRFRRITNNSIATSAGPGTALRTWVASRARSTIRTEAHAFQVPFDYRSLPLDQRFIDGIHRTGAQVHAWTVNDEAPMRRLLDMGVDGIVTDRPDLLNTVLAAGEADVD